MVWFLRERHWAAGCWLLVNGVHLAVSLLYLPNGLFLCLG